MELENNSPYIAFLVNLELVDTAGAILTPVFWEDNFISLLPYEKRVVRANFESHERMYLKIKGWNVQQVKYTAKSKNLVTD